MPYRILSSKLGYSLPQSSLDEAMKLKIDLIGADAGSMDFGPYYLGSGECYFHQASLKHDFSFLLDAALKQDCPLIVGTMGTTGAKPQMDFMLQIIKEVFREKNIHDLKLAIIPGDVDSSLLLGHVDELRPLGRMPKLTADMVQKSVMVGQMGIAPFITALDAGAKVILAGRACDVAIFAADPIRRGFDAALAFQAAHILECGAIACDPGSASDYLVGEFREDNSVVFTPPNPERRATPYSISAHTLYEESHPALQYYPEGILDMRNTEYFEAGERSAGIRNMKFIHSPLSVKIEGSLNMGRHCISLLAMKKEILKADAALIGDNLLYGLNGVEASQVTAEEQEIGILLKVTNNNEEDAKTLASILKGFLLHFGYPGRITTAGNVAFPLSPSEFTMQENNLQYTTIIVAGTREPLFIQQIDEIFVTIENLAQQSYPELWADSTVQLTRFDENQPLMLVETIADTFAQAVELQAKELEKVTMYIDKKAQAYLNLDLGNAYIWSVYHIWADEKMIQEKLFPVKFYHINGDNWNFIEEKQSQAVAVGLQNNQEALDDRSIDIIEENDKPMQPVEVRPLKEMVKVLRSKDAGINTITYDIFFKSQQEYKIALSSNLFNKKSIAKILRIPESDIIGVFKADSCFAIKIACYRTVISGYPGCRDVFGAQQHMKIELMQIPIG